MTQISYLTKGDKLLPIGLDRRNLYMAGPNWTRMVAGGKIQDEQECGESYVIGRENG